MHFHREHTTHTVQAVLCTARCTELSWRGANLQEVTVSDADVTSAISHHDRSQMMTELLPIFQVMHSLQSTA